MLKRLRSLLHPERCPYRGDNAKYAKPIDWLWTGLCLAVIGIVALIFISAFL